MTIATGLRSPSSTRATSTRPSFSSWPTTALLVCRSTTAIRRQRGRWLGHHGSGAGLPLSGGSSSLECEAFTGCLLFKGDCCYFIVVGIVFLTVGSEYRFCYLKFMVGESLYLLYLLHMQLGSTATPSWRSPQPPRRGGHLRRRVRGIRPRLCRLALLRTIGAPFDPGEADRTCRKGGLFGRREARRSTGRRARPPIWRLADRRRSSQLGHWGMRVGLRGRGISAQSHSGEKHISVLLPAEINHSRAGPSMQATASPRGNGGRRQRRRGGR